MKSAIVFVLRFSTWFNRNYCTYDICTCMFFLYSFKSTVQSLKQEAIFLTIALHIVCTKVACVWEGPASSQIFNICYRVPNKQPTCDYMTIPTEETE